MRIKQEYVDWRGLWIGEYDEYAKGVQGVLRRSMKMRFISTDTLEDLVEKCYIRTEPHSVPDKRSDP